MRLQVNPILARLAGLACLAGFLLLLPGLFLGGKPWLIWAGLLAIGAGVGALAAGIWAYRGLAPERDSSARHGSEPEPFDRSSALAGEGDRFNEAIYHIAQSASTAESLPDLLHAIHSALLMVMPAENFYIALLDEETGLLTYPIFVDQHESTPDPQPLGHGLTEYVLRSGRSLLASPQVFDDLVASGEVEPVGAPGIDWAGAPLRAGDETFGVLVVQTYREGVPFGQRELAILEFVASQIAPVIERKKSKQALRESEARLQDLFDNSPIGIYRTTPDGRILLANPALVRMFGYESFEDLACHNLNDECFGARETRRRLNDQLEANGTLYGEESTWLKKDGSPIIIRENARLVTLKGSQELVYEGTVEDITERRRTEEALQKSEARFRSLFDYSPISLWEEDFSDVKKAMDDLRQQGVTDLSAYIQQNPDFVKECTRKLKVMDINQNTLKLFKAESKEQLLNQVQTVFGIDSYALMLSELYAIWKGETSFEGEGKNTDMLGNPIGIRLHWAVAPGYEASMANVIVSIMDITEQMEAERALVRRAEELSVLHAVTLAGAEARDEDELFERVTTLIGDILYPDQFGIILLTPDGSGLVKHPSYRGLTPQEMEYVIPYGRGVSGKVVRTGQPLRIADVRKVVDYIPTEMGTRSELCAPIKIGETVLGVINAESMQLNAFTGADEHIILTLAGQLAIAMERLRTQVSERQQANRLAAIYEISQEVVGTSLEPEQVYKAIHQAVSKLMPTEAFVIAILDEGSGFVDAVYQVDRGGRFPPARFPLSRGLSGRVIREGKSFFIPDILIDEFNPHTIHFGTSETVRSILAVPIRLAGKVIGNLSTQSYSVNAFEPADLNVLELLANYAAIALGNARLYQATRQQAEEFGVLVKVSSALRIAHDWTEMLPIILDQLCELLRIESIALALKDNYSEEFVFALAKGKWQDLSGIHVQPGEGLVGQVLVIGRPAYNQHIDLHSPDNYNGVMQGDPVTCVSPLLVQDKPIGAIWVGCTTNFSQQEIHLLTMVSDIAANAIHRSMLHEQTLRHAGQMATVSATGRALAETFDLPQIYNRLSRSILTVIPEAGSMYILMASHSDATLSFVHDAGSEAHPAARELPPVSLRDADTDSTPSAGQANPGSIFKTSLALSQPFCVDELITLPPSEDRSIIERLAVPTPRSFILTPMQTKGEALGLILVTSQAPNRFREAEAELLTLIGSTAAIAIENARLFKETEQRLNRLAALRAMDVAISSSFDLRVTLNVLLTQITAQLEIDAAAVLLYDASTQMLEYTASRGFRTASPARTQLRLDEDAPGKVARERRIISGDDFPTYVYGRRFEGEGFVAYHGAPLIAKGQLKGVLEIFHRSPLNPDAEWLEFLETLAGDTAIAIDNTNLFNDLQRSNVDLTLSYDTTLEGWTRILELRDQDTQGHTQRVVDLTQMLALSVGVPEASLVHLRRGALLHDIGKMAIPDQILHKPGPLSPEEWSIMKMHPVYANEMLLPIAYLRPSLEIPYCHHEKWDGSGYPQGLEGHQIPLSARIFSVVDVWDALRSDRPYRPAWSDQEALNYILTQSGKHFDPQIVPLFKKIVCGD